MQCPPEAIFLISENLVNDYFIRAEGGATKGFLFFRVLFIREEVPAVDILVTVSAEVFPV